MKNYMKNATRFIALLGFMVLLYACKKTPSKTQTQAPPGETEVNVPCSGTEYFSNSEVFRANSIGESSDQVVAKKKALTNARAELAASVQTMVKTVTDNYVNSREFNNKEEVEERFESLTREVVAQEIPGTVVICEKQTRTAEGRYKTYIALELAASELLTAYNERLSNDERLRIDYDYEKFKKTFEEEMNKMGR